MAAALQAIPTRYSGYHFRSRLEARWAVFFDAMGLEWEYEPQGFNINGVYYLPDFRVTTLEGVQIWYEIKPRAGTNDLKHEGFFRSVRNLNNCGDVPNDWADVPGIRAQLVLGDPTDHFMSRDFLIQWVCPRCGDIVKDENCYRPPIAYLPTGELDFYCWDCDCETPSGGGHGKETGFAGLVYYPHKGTICTEWHPYVSWQQKLVDACDAARSARFEHGECGAT